MVYFWMIDVYRPVNAERITIRTKNGIPKASTNGANTLSIALPTPTRSHSMLYENIISIINPMAIHMPYLSQIFPRSICSPENVSEFPPGPVEQEVCIRYHLDRAAGHHRVCRGNGTVELLVFRDRSCAFLVPGSGFICHAPHEDLVIIGLDED